MKRKILVVGIAGLVLVGGAFGVSAFANSDQMGLTNLNKSDIISIDKAKEIASKEAKGAKVESIQLETEHGVLVYDVDLDYTGSDDDVDVDVDAKTGEVIRVNHDDDDDKYDDDMNITQNKAIISNEKAIEIATKDTPGNILEMELDDDGYYEFEIKHNDGYRVELKIDAISGEIIKKEIED